MRGLILFLFVVSGCASALGQDRIFLRDSTVIEADIVRIDRNMVRYRKFNSQDLKVYNLRKAEIEKIIMAKGGQLTFDPVPAKDPSLLQNSHYIGASFGLSTPISDFASKDIDNANAGLAVAGYGWQVEGAYFFTPNTGISGTIGGFVNNESESTVEETVRLLNPGAVDYQVSSGTWSSVYALVGIQFTVNADRFLWDLKLSAGTVITSEPSFRILVDDGTNIFERFNTQNTVTSGGIHFGTAGRVPIGEHIALRLGLDLIVSEPRFNTRITELENGQQTSTFGVIR
ncbi:MAG: hypothetical protein AAGB22_15000, partial [Bacteroidota bacterium]